MSSLHGFQPVACFHVPLDPSVTRGSLTIQMFRDFSVIFLKLLWSLTPLRSENGTWVISAMLSWPSLSYDPEAARPAGAASAPQARGGVAGQRQRAASGFCLYALDSLPALSMTGRDAPLSPSTVVGSSNPPLNLVSFCSLCVTLCGQVCERFRWASPLRGPPLE